MLPKIEKTKLNIQFAIKFAIIGALISSIVHLFWKDLNGIKYTIATGILIGFTVGIVEPLVTKIIKYRIPYLIILFIRIIINFIIVTLSTALSIWIYLSIHGLTSSPLSDPIVRQAMKADLMFTDVNVLVTILIISLVSLLWQMSYFFGEGVLWNYITGKYYKPSTGERIFMFLDLNDATTIAEKIGPTKYSSLVREFFDDLDEAFTRTKGEVFQYVGDEVVVMWNPKKGLKSNNCIYSFLIATENIKKKENHYINQYGFYPNFKAAIHIGEVSITEIGISKKEIAYHGDAINTTARICSSAHKLGKNFLISKTLFDRLEKNGDNLFENIGKQSFKGKEENIELYSLK